MKGFLLMWALSPTDSHIMDAFAHTATATYESCEFIKSEILLDHPDAYLFCIGVNELNHLREEPI